MKRLIATVLFITCFVICFAACHSSKPVPSQRELSGEWRFSDTAHWRVPQPDGENDAVIAVVYDYADHVDEDKDRTCDVCGYPLKSLSDYLIEEEGRLYLLLPASKLKLRVDDSFKPQLDSIDLDLLKAAEEKILNQLAQYSQEPHLILETRDGGLGLYAEVIVHIDPPASAEGAQKGCGIDHEHIVFYERITK